MTSCPPSLLRPRTRLCSRAAAGSQPWRPPAGPATARRAAQVTSAAASRAPAAAPEGRAARAPAEGAGLSAGAAGAGVVRRPARRLSRASGPGRERRGASGPSRRWPSRRWPSRRGRAAGPSAPQAARRVVRERPNVEVRPRKRGGRSGCPAGRGRRAHRRGRAAERRAAAQGPADREVSGGERAGWSSLSWRHRHSLAAAGPGLDLAAPPPRRWPSCRWPAPDPARAAGREGGTQAARAVRTAVAQLQARLAPGRVPGRAGRPPALALPRSGSRSRGVLPPLTCLTRPGRHSPTPHRGRGPAARLRSPRDAPARPAAATAYSTKGRTAGRRRRPPVART